MSDDERALEHAYKVQCPCVGRDSSEPYGYLCLDHYRMTRVEWEATIDYEAAMIERRNIVWAHHGMGPLVDECGDVEINGVKVPRVSDYDETVRIVDAAVKEDTK